MKINKTYEIAALMPVSVDESEWQIVDSFKTLHKALQEATRLEDKGYTINVIATTDVGLAKASQTLYDTNLAGYYAKMESARKAYTFVKNADELAKQEKVWDEMEARWAKRDAEDKKSSVPF